MKKINVKKTLSDRAKTFRKKGTHKSKSNPGITRVSPRKGKSSNVHTNQQKSGIVKPQRKGAKRKGMTQLKGNGSIKAVKPKGSIKPLKANGSIKRKKATGGMKQIGG